MKKIALAVLAVIAVSACEPYEVEGCFYDDRDGSYSLTKFEREKDVPREMFQIDMNYCIGGPPEPSDFEEPEFD